MTEGPRSSRAGPLTGAGAQASGRLGPGGRERWPQSYRRRQGQTTSAQRKALSQNWQRYGLHLEHGQELDLVSLFGRSAPCTLEIGHGMGENLLAQAQAHPERDFLGLEVHVPALGAVSLALAELGLSNVRLARIDAIRLLNDHVHQRLFEQAWVFFPDPFPREPHRRLIRPLLLELLWHAMGAGGELWLATDVAQYAAHVRQVFEQDDRWSARAASPRFRALTRYEAKGLEQGSQIHELRFVAT